MKKQRLSMAIRRAAVVMIAAIAVSCQTSPLTTDYGMTSNLSKTSTSTIYPNSTVPLKLEVKSAAKGTVNVKYLSSSLQGSLLIDNKEYQPGQSFEHDFSTPLYMSFVPTQAGQAELKFQISNDLVTTDASVSFLVDEAAYELQMISDTAVTVGIKENLTFAIRELQTKARAVSKTPSNKFKITARINKGRGVLQVKDKILDDNSAESALAQSQAATKSVLMKTLAETKTEASSVEVAKDEETPMYYTSMAIGENALIFDIADEYENTVSATVNLKANSPTTDLKISLNQDSVYKAAVLHNFTLFPDTKELNTKLTLSWAVNKNSSMQDISVMHKSLPILAGDKIDLASNYANPMGVITNSVGDLAVDFQIRDEYGSQYDTTITLKIVSPTVDFTFPDVAENLSEWKPYEWTGNLVAEAGTNSYQISYKNDDPTAGVLTINGVVPIDGDRTDLNSGKNVFKYTPKKTGIHNMTFVVYDKFGNEKTFPVKFTVATNNLGVTVAKVPQVNYSQSVNVNVNVPGQDHIKSFKGVVSSLEGGAADIEVNGTKVTENKEFDLKAGTNVFKVTPTKVASEYAFTLLVRTDIGQEEKHEVVVPIILPELTARLTTLVGKCDLTGSLIYELQLSEPHYTGKFTIGASIINGTDGTVSIAGKTVTNNQSATIAKAGTVPITFTPKSAGGVEINLRVADENGQEKAVTLTGQVNNPPLTASTSADGRKIKYKTETPFTLTINEALHTDPFSVIPTFEKGSGILKINDKQVTPGVNIDLKNGIHNCAFTPDNCGEVDIQFTVEDTHNKNIKAHALFTVDPYPLSFTMDNVSASEVNITVPVTFTLKIDEEQAPESPYQLTYTADNKGTVKVGEAVFAPGTSKSLTKGTHSLSYTPTATGTHQVVFTLQDMFGQEKTATLNVDAKNAPLEAAASAGELTTNVKKAVAFTISANETDYTDQFAVTVTNSGDGSLTVSGSPVTFDKSFNVAKGNTTMSYTPNTLGKHTLGFTVKDIYGQTKQFNVVVTSNYAPMTATASAPSSVYIGRDATISLSLSEENYSSTFEVSYTGGTGTLKLNSPWTAGSKYSVPSGSTNLTYTPTATGSHQLNFTFTDSYGQTKQSSVTINVTQAPLTVSATPATCSVYVGKAAISTLAVSEASHTGQFTISPTISGSGTLTINGQQVSSGGSIKVDAGNAAIGFTPATSGQHTVTMNVTDAYSQSKATTFTVTANEPEISASVTSSSTYTTKPVELVLNLDKPDYTGTFSTTIQQSGNGSLVFSGGGSAGGTQTLGKGATRFTYTPTTTGTHTITFTIRTSDGKTKTVTSTINVSYSQLTMNINPQTSNYVTAATESTNYKDITVLINRIYYSGGLKLALEKITTNDQSLQNSCRLNVKLIDLNGKNTNFQYIGEYTVNSDNLNGIYSSTEAQTATNGKTIYATFRCYGLYTLGSPQNATRVFTLHFKGTDDNGQTITETVNIEVSLP